MENPNNPSMDVILVVFHDGILIIYNGFIIMMIIIIINIYNNNTKIIIINNDDNNIIPRKFCVAGKVFRIPTV